MKFILPFAVAICLGAPKLATAEESHYTCAFDRFDVLKTIGAAETWGVNGETVISETIGGLVLGAGCKHKGKQAFSALRWTTKHINGGDCNPVGAKAFSTDEYPCNLYYDDSKSTAEWCYDVGSDDTMQYSLAMQLGDYSSGGSTSGPIIDVTVAESPSDASYEKYFTKSGPAAHRARFYVNCEKVDGSNCADAGFQYDAATDGYKTSSDAKKDVAVTVSGGSGNGFRLYWKEETVPHQPIADYRDSTGLPYGSFDAPSPAMVGYEWSTFGLTPTSDDAADSLVANIVNGIADGDNWVLNLTEFNPSGSSNGTRVVAVEAELEPGNGMVVFQKPDADSSGPFMAFCTSELFKENVVQYFLKFEDMKPMWASKFHEKIGSVRYESTKHWHDSLCGKIREAYSISPYLPFEAKCDSYARIGGQNCDVSTLYYRSATAI